MYSYLESPTVGASLDTKSGATSININDPDRLSYGSKKNQSNNTSPSLSLRLTIEPNPPTYKNTGVKTDQHVPKSGTSVIDLPVISRKLQLFPTGSSYEGEWNILGMSGRGVYTFPSGVRYEGEFEANEFHGDGKLVYPNGCEIHGKWAYGKIIEKKVIFQNGLQYEENDWEYCKIPDRRYDAEVENDIKPAGESYKTAEVPAPEIPLGMYDTGYGFYDRNSGSIHKYSDYGTVVRVPAAPERQWIKKTNRYNPVTPLGPQRQLYEEWQKPLLEMPEDIRSKWSMPSTTKINMTSKRHRFAH